MAEGLRIAAHRNRH